MKTGYDSLTCQAAFASRDAYLDPCPPDGGQLLSDAGTDAQVVVRVTGGRFVAAFRGSSSTMDWTHNLLVPMTRLPSAHPPAVRAHAGFVRQYTSLHARIMSALEKSGVKDVLLCGHSLGGALACIAAAMLPTKYRCDVVTFGSPRPGNEYMCGVVKARCTSFTRVVHDNDVVPTVPARAMGYYHVSDPWVLLDSHGAITYMPRERNLVAAIWLRLRSLVTLDLGVSDHFMRNYMRGIGAEYSQHPVEHKEEQQKPARKEEKQEPAREEEQQQQETAREEEQQQETAREEEQQQEQQQETAREEEQQEQQQETAREEEQQEQQQETAREEEQQEQQQEQQQEPAREEEQQEQPAE